jgi:uncharacterized membrane protein YjjP (DUF1212 family)
MQLLIVFAELYIGALTATAAALTIYHRGIYITNTLILILSILVFVAGFKNLIQLVKH